MPGSPVGGDVPSDELANAVVVELPLRDDRWVAVNSPADRIPSHGTDLLGQRYAFDFIRTDARPRLHYHRASWLRTLIVGVPTRECYAWGRPVHSVFDATIVVAVDGVPERRRVHPVREAILAIRNGLRFTPDRLPEILGNHVVAKYGDLVAVYAHLAPGSVIVTSGQAVRAGERIGSVGHTGNSTTPHLHFQLIKATDDLTKAVAVPCAFRTYEVLRRGGWETVDGGIPGRHDRIRSLEAVVGGEGLEPPTSSG